MGDDLPQKKVASPEAKSGDILQSAIDFIKEFEGCELKAYNDGVGVWTIGYGTTWWHPTGRAVMPGDVISKDVAEDFLRHDLNKFLDKLTKTIPGWDRLTEGQKVCLLSFAYNTGYSYPSNGFNTLNECVRAQDWSRLPSVIKLYVNPGTNTEAGLKRRREAEGKLWRS